MKIIKVRSLGCKGKEEGSREKKKGFEDSRFRGVKGKRFKRLGTKAESEK